jgi:uncharacterized protein involved in outer membrane biogenesis
LTESGIQIENMRLLGAWIFNFQNSLTLDAAVDITGLNVDNILAPYPFISWMAENANANSSEQKTLPLTDWLNKVDVVLRIKGALNQYMLHGKPRDKMEFGVELTKGKLDFKQLILRLNGTTITGSAQLTASGKKPEVTLQLDCDNMDVNQYFGIATSRNTLMTMTPDHWSKEEFKLLPFNLVNSTFNLSCSTLTYNGTLMQDFSAVGNLDNGDLNFEHLNANVFGANFKAHGKLGVGKLPTLGIAFTLDNIAAEQLNNVIPLFKGMVGHFNLSASISTSGINMYSWVSNALGTINVFGRDIVVRGFNLQGIVRSVSAVRSTADIVNVIRLAYPGGDTQISELKGTYNLAQGVLDTPGVDFTTPVAPGRLSGKVNILDWTIDNSAAFRLTVLNEEKPPVLTLQIIGSLDNPKLGLDTSSLEEYVAIKTREKLLQTLP